MSKTNKLILFFVLILGVVTFSTFYFVKRTIDRKLVYVSGNIEATDVRLAFRMQGKIKELLADEGNIVKAGDVLARLEIDEITKVKEEAGAALKAAESVNQRAEDDYARLENLFKAGAISQQERDNAKTLAESSKANMDAKKSYFELTLVRFGFTDLFSPIDGYVLSKSAEIGEVVQPGSVIFTVADLKNLYLTAYINETDLGRVKLDQETDITTDTFSGKIYQGKISFVSSQAEFTPKQIQTTEERVKLVYRIKIKIDNKNLELKPGMPADALIKIEIK